MLEPTMAWILGGVLMAYLGAMFVIAWLSRKRIRSVDDFIVAQRRLPLFMAAATLLATWFGAGTLLTQADEVRNEGLHRAALDPWGAGVCLLIAGLFFARRLWEMKLLTMPDFFRKRFGPTAEVAAAFIMVPSYFGWIAVQFVALGAVLHSLFGIDQNLAIFLVAIVGMGYTLMGGMWSVTHTDAIQMALILLGLVVMGFAAMVRLGHGEFLPGIEHLLAETDGELLRPIPAETFPVLAAWLGVFCIGALGNIPVQDLAQRIFSAKSAGVARKACLLAGGLYLVFGTIPLFLGLAGRLILPEAEESVIMELAHELLRPHPIALILFILALVSAVLSTIDSAILAPASVFSQNILSKFRKVENDARESSLSRVRWSVLGITAASLTMAYVGAGAYELLEGAYSLPLVGLFAPLTLGLYLKPRGQMPAVLSIVTGTGLWLGHYVVELWTDADHGFLGSGLPVPLISMLLGLGAYLVAHFSMRRTAA